MLMNFHKNPWTQTKKQVSSTKTLPKGNQYSDFQHIDYFL